MKTDVLIVGGGATGLWLLDRLRAQDIPALLVESRALGAGQTIVSQGILHGGLKYSLQGFLAAAAREAREMPARWKASLRGEALPDLSAVAVRSDSFLLWGMGTAASRIGLLGAKIGLRMTPENLAADEWPEVLRGCGGHVFRVAEQVISPQSLLAALAARAGERILKIDAAQGIVFGERQDDTIRATLRADGGKRELTVEARHVVLAAGGGNAALREQLGLSGAAMQRRPLHVIVARGNLPEFYGHCIDGAKTRVSITSARDLAGNVIWQIGGQVSEKGVAMSADELICHTRGELRAVLPSLDFGGVEWATLRVDRAEGTTLTGGRPDTYRLLRNGRILTAWPTKLVLVPQLADEITAVISQERPAVDCPLPPTDWPRPSVAAPCWEEPLGWRTDREIAWAIDSARESPRRKSA